jgi:hypothetical protein
MKRTINEFTKIQRHAAILVSGAFKSTSAAALNASDGRKMVFLTQKEACGNHAKRSF